MPHYVPFRYTQKIQISPVLTEPPNAKMEDHFALYIQYSEEETAQRYFTVFIPKPVQKFFHEGLVTGLHLQYLPLDGLQNSEVSQAIPGGPVWVVLGIESRGGARIDCVPKSLIHLFKRTLMGSFVVCGVGAALALTEYSWVGGLLFGYGLSRGRFAFKVPRKVDWPKP